MGKSDNRIIGWDKNAILFLEKAKMKLIDYVYHYLTKETEERIKT